MIFSKISRRSAVAVALLFLAGCGEPPVPDVEKTPGKVIEQQQPAAKNPPEPDAVIPDQKSSEQFSKAGQESGKVKDRLEATDEEIQKRTERLDALQKQSKELTKNNLNHAPWIQMFQAFNKAAMGKVHVESMSSSYHKDLVDWFDKLPNEAKAGLAKQNKNPKPNGPGWAVTLTVLPIGETKEVEIPQAIQEFVRNLNSSKVGEDARLSHAVVIGPATLKKRGTAYIVECAVQSIEAKLGT